MSWKTDKPALIVHRPFGLGHLYRLEPDQRVPPVPSASDSIELRATAQATVTHLVLEGSIGGKTVTIPAVPVRVDNVGFLESAPMVQDAERPSSTARQSWRVVLEPLPAGTRVSYHFVDPESGYKTRRFGFTVATWLATGGHLLLCPPDSRTRLVDDSTRWLVAGRGPTRLRFALHLPLSAHVVGFGERFDALDQRGRRLDAAVFDPYLDHGNRSYMPMPFGIVVPTDGTPGFGFHVRTSRRTWFDIGATVPEELGIEVALNPEERAPTVELAIYEGSPGDVLRAFLNEVGPSPWPADWVFRPWMSGNEWNTQARVRLEVERSFGEAIPVGVIVVEAWSDENTFAAFRDATYAVHADGSPHVLADFAFAPDGAWPDPRGLVNWLHERGIRVLLWQVPVLPGRPPQASQAAADERVMVGRGYAVRGRDGRPYRIQAKWFRGGLVLDPTNRAATDWWLAKRRYLVAEVGVDGFKTDGGEHVWGDALRYADGTKGAESNNRYPVRYVEAYHRLLCECGHEPVTFSRAGFVGSQRLPCQWAGDARSSWQTFRASITAGLSAGASGIFFWGWDLAGFSGELPSTELYLRATATACFCPIMQYHSEFNRHRLPSRDRTPWNVAERTGDERVLQIFRQFAQLRERLVPYLAEQARLAAEGGRPLMRALAFEWPGDELAWSHPYEFMLGNALLVAPVVQPGISSWPVYLPPGDWIQPWTGARHRGSRIVSCDAPLDRIPVFVRITAEGDAQSLPAWPRDWAAVGSGRIDSGSDSTI